MYNEPPAGLTEENVKLHEKHYAKNNLQSGKDYYTFRPEEAYQHAQEQEPADNAYHTQQ